MNYQLVDCDMEESTKKEERNMFLFITVVLFPLLTIMLVGGYGFVIWILQMIFGPPTAPH